MFETLLQNRLRILWLAVLLPLNVALGDDATPVQSAPIAVMATNSVSAPPQNQLQAGPSVVSPGSGPVVILPASPSGEENQKQRVRLLGLMLALTGIAVWRQFRRRRA